MLVHDLPDAPVRQDGSGAEFLHQLRASGLLSKEQLLEWIPRLETDALSAGNSSEGWIKELTRHKLLTRWQAGMVLAGNARGCFLGRYKLLDEIGRGGMGRVYLAEHVLMHRKVAIKVVAKSEERGSRIDRFLLESRAAAGLDHPHVVRVYHLDQELSDYYLVMEYIDGEDLKQRTERLGPLDFVSAADYIRQAALGLQYLHDQGLIHRDVKPANMLVDQQGVVKLLDLGLVRFMIEGAITDGGLTADDRVLGTADYIAPEQIRNSHDVDHRTDLYSLGGAMYFLLTGQAPFAGYEVFERLHKHMLETPRSIRVLRLNAPDTLVAICEKLLSKQPEDRYPSAAAVAEALAAWLASPEAATPDASTRGSVDSFELHPDFRFLDQSRADGSTDDHPSAVRPNMALPSGASPSSKPPASSADAPSEKEAALASFAGGIAHRLNNLLQCIEGGASLAQLDLQAGSETGSDLADIQASVRAAAELTDQLLIVAGRASLAQSPCKLGDLLDEVARWLSSTASHQVEFRREIPSGLPLVLGDAAQLRRMLLNLLSNARDALPSEGGVITLRAKSRASEPRPEIDLEIQDNGCGMNEATQRRMFDPFFSTQTPERGLGLAVVRGIVTGHGGRISIESQPRQGTTVKVTLPAIPAPVQSSSINLLQPPKRGTVLVVDDEERIRDLTRRLLGRFGFDVLTAKDGVEAVDIYRRQSAKIDLVLLDQWMPGMCGEKALEQMRGIRSGMRAILSSGSVDQATMRRLSRQGQIGFIQKPYQATALVDEVNRQLALAS